MLLQVPLWHAARLQVGGWAGGVWWPLADAAAVAHIQAEAFKVGMARAMRLLQSTLAAAVYKKF